MVLFVFASFHAIVSGPTDPRGTFREPKPFYYKFEVNRHLYR